MKTIFSKDIYEELVHRTEALNPKSKAVWGKMDVAQMLAHLNNSLDNPLGKKPFRDESNWILRNVFKSFVLKDAPIRKNAPTAKSFKVVDPKIFDSERKKLLENLKDAHDRGLHGTYLPHVSFGVLTPEEWGGLFYRHTNHHLSQFGV